MKKQCVLLLFIVLSKVAVTQEPVADTSLTAIAKQNAILNVKERARAYDLLYQGIEYLFYGHGIDGHPYYETDSFRRGSVWYNGLEFDDADLLYDISRDQLIIPYRYSTGMLQLVTAKISRFSIGGQSFIQVSSDTNLVNTPEEGFYELVYDSKSVQLLVKHRKDIKVPAKTDAKPFFNYVATYFIKKNNRFYLIRGEKDVLAMMPEKKAEIKKIVKEQQLSFRKNKVGYLVTLLKHFL